MEFIKKLETTVAGWVKNLPHLPPAGQKWLAHNVWWIALIGAIASGIAVLVSLFGILLGGAAASYIYVVDPGFAAWVLLTGIVSLVFTTVRGLLLAMAVSPLQKMQKKGWVLLFISWLVNAVAVVVGAILSLSVIGFIGAILFGAIGLAISGYFIFEIHGQFAHSPRVTKVTKTSAKKA
ncbi:MAG: hypothetical protein K5Q00_01920 [Gammaproteobacteria bacterium]|nr:hypothetical protein [Gammaproteobacteria bacterium]